MEAILLDGFEFIEILVLGAIAIELLALYRHTKFDQRIDNHIRDTNERLEKTDRIVGILDKHIMKFDDHIEKVDNHMQKVSKHMGRLEKDLTIYSETINNENKCD